MTFGKRLQELRLRAGLTQEQLASAARVPIGTLRHYEQGQREPLWDVVFVLAKALGVGCDAFADCVTRQTPAAKKPAAKSKSNNPKKKGTNP